MEREPVLILHTKQETLDAILNPAWMDTESKWRTKSDWLISIIGEGFATNRAIQERAETELGVTQPYNGSPLSTLVYNAQRYRDDDQLRAAGFEPLTQELIEHAYLAGAKIVFQDGTSCTIREINGTRHLFKPRRRVWTILPIRQPVRLVP